MAIRDLPEYQKIQWRDLFDHYIFDNDGTLLEQQPSDTWNKYKTGSSGTNESNVNQDDSTDIEWKYQEGRRFGITPEFAQDNGSFYIDLNQGRIHFSGGVKDLDESRGSSTVVHFVLYTKPYRLPFTERHEVTIYFDNDDYQRPLGRIKISGMKRVDIDLKNCFKK